MKRKIAETAFRDQLDGLFGNRDFLVENGGEEGFAATLDGLLERIVRDCVVRGHNDPDIVNAAVDVCSAHFGYRLKRSDVERIVTQQRAKFIAEREGLVDDGFLSELTDPAMSKLFERIEAVRGWHEDNAFQFGISELDQLTGGVQPGEMLSLLGHQGSMKTSLLLSGLENALSRGYRVQFFSLDMTPGEIQERRIQRRLKCHQTTMHRMFRERHPAVKEAIDDIRDGDAGRFDLIGNDSGPLWNVKTLENRVQRYMPDVLAIDYLTLLRTARQSDLDCANECMVTLKGLTQKCQIRTIILSQMSRASKREQASGITGGHGKGSGLVEELSHSEIELFKDNDSTSGLPGKIVATVTKTRRGPSGRSYSLEYEPECMLFTGKAVRVKRAGRGAQKAVFEQDVLEKAFAGGRAYKD